MDFMLFSLYLLLISLTRKTDAVKHFHGEPAFATGAGLGLNETSLHIGNYDSHNIMLRNRRHKTNSARLIPRHLRDPLTVLCGKDQLQLQVRTDYFGAGKSLLKAAELTFGTGCRSKEEATDTIIFSCFLHACGNLRTVTDTQLIYSNSLFYTPSVGTTQRPREIATVHCHYARKPEVSSSSVKPTWSPRSFLKSMGGLFDFSLDIMSEDWRTKSKTNVYYLGQNVNLQVSVNLYKHEGFKIFVDSCVALPSGELSWEKSYPMIHDYGCLVDSRVSHSMARFLKPRSDSTLRFQLRAFQFKGQRSDVIFIHCTLKVIDKGAPSSVKTKSCHYNADSRRWEELEGQTSLCDCCETQSCERRKRKTRNVSLTRPEQWNHWGTFEVSAGPLYVLSPVATDATITTRRDLWHTLSLKMGGARWMTVGQGISVATSTLCTVCILLGLLRMCIHQHPTHTL